VFSLSSVGCKSLQDCLKLVAMKGVCLERRTISTITVTFALGCNLDARKLFAYAQKTAACGSTGRKNCGVLDEQVCS
jgi:hypothetical protein